MLGARACLLRSDMPPPHRWSDDSADSTWVLFPSDDAVPLEQVRGRIRTLIVPDGTWAQTRRIARRHLGCRDVAKVQLVNPPASGYRLRRNRGFASLCTLEAVAYALAVLEGPGCAHAMLASFGTWVERALLVRAGAHETRPAEPRATDLPNEWTNSAIAR
jgi:DTW domain-containing protein YfiP